MKLDTQNGIDTPIKIVPVQDDFKNGITYHQTSGFDVFVWGI